jgi:hypothetical protein
MFGTHIHYLKLSSYAELHRFARWTNNCLTYGVKLETEYRLAGYKFDTKSDAEMAIVPAIILLWVGSSDPQGRSPTITNRASYDCSLRPLTLHPWITTPSFRALFTRSYCPLTVVSSQTLTLHLHPVSSCFVHSHLILIFLPSRSYQRFVVLVVLHSLIIF